MHHLVAVVNAGHCINISSLEGPQGDFSWPFVL